jgi:hypothetical protein
MFKIGAPTFELLATSFDRSSQRVNRLLNDYKNDPEETQRQRHFGFVILIPKYPQE